MLRDLDFWLFRRFELYRKIDFYIFAPRRNRRFVKQQNKINAQLARLENTEQRQLPQ